MAGAAERRVVTVLFADLVGSTGLAERLDAEAVRALLEQYFALAARAIEAHGGTLERLIGDGLLAVFGLDPTHEDDALRAVRAGLELRAALEELEPEAEGRWGGPLGVRIGINTGEVVVGETGEGVRTVIGDAVNVAARLEQDALPGQILIGAVTQGMVAAWAELEPLEPLELRGKREPVPAWSVVAVDDPTAPADRPHDVPLAGRERELALLLDVVERCTDDRAAHLVTLLGPTGIGKSRLVRECVDRLGDRVTPVVGRCLPYGDGITFWPLNEVVGQLCAGGDPGELLGDGGEAAAAASLIRAATGRGTAVGGLDETFWAVRRLFEAAARPRPLVCVFDDVQWAEPTMLDLIEHLADWIADAPVTLICIARPELLERRTGWAGGKLRATSAMLGPLDPRHCDELVDRFLSQMGGSAGSLPAETRREVLEATEGNPLFIEHLLRAVGPDGAAPAEMPPTVQSAIAARLDALSPAERRACELGAVMGKVFAASAMEALDDEDAAESLGALAPLVRKGILRSSPVHLGDRDAYRFTHLLIRDVTSARMSKQRRAELHERFAGWLRGRSDPAPDALVGYHLEQTVVLRRAIGLAGPELDTVAVDAATLLTSSARRSEAMFDLPAAVRQLERAELLLRCDEPRRLELLPALARTRHRSGDLAGAGAVLDEAIVGAAASGDRRTEALAALGRAVTRIDAPGGRGELARAAQRAADVCEAAGDGRGLAQAWARLALVRQMEGRYGSAAEAHERALGHLSPGEPEQLLLVGNLALCHALGPLPAAQALARCERLEASCEGSSPMTAALVAGPAAVLRAHTGAIAAARAQIEHARHLAEDIGEAEAAGHMRMFSGMIEELAGDLDAAFAHHQAAAEWLERAQDDPAEALVGMSRCLTRQGDAIRGRELAERCSGAVPDDLNVQVLWRVALSRADAALGEPARARCAAEQAVELTRRMECPELLADALRALGSALAAAGGDGSVQMGEALAVDERKGLAVRVGLTKAQ